MRSRAFKLSAMSLAILGATLGAPAFAQWASGSPYVGINVGRTTSDFGGNGGFAGGALTSEDDRERGVKIYGGYQFHRNFAVEGGFYDLGRFDANFAGGGGALAGSTRFRGLNLDLVGMIPFSDRFSAFARIGAAYTQGRSNATATAPFAGGSRREREFGPKYGVGLEYAFTPNWAARAEWERYQRVEDPIRGRGHVDMLSVGVVYRWGVQTVQAPARIITAPPPPPPPAPRYVPPPPPPPAVISPPPPPPPPAPAPAPAPRPYRN